MKAVARMLLVTALTMTGRAGATDSAATTHTVAALAREAGSFFEGNQPGGVVLITRGNEVLLRQASGMADVENRVAMQPDAALRLASMSKQFTAMAVLQLVQAGKLRVDASVVSLDPALHGPLGKVTLQ
ncbi:beta-lactamase family protein [Xanthomonas campestris pv. asclepiadis]|uniref:serine hydrolase domain-containing protein n=1 Tax=Xanthomonas campestris TaxID=339 RepID=UPI001E362176|nr:serine hydrolase domain-containing protein [Xanthomonas campestris]MCC4615895.1 beta-lactamase family protein [Xanthomonas campestris pv. asclepiadis]